jgi:DEP domain-containing protein 5
MYFEKFLRDFVSPIFDSWRSLGSSHMLTIIFFARTLYLDDRISHQTCPELFSKKSFVNNDGYYQQDHYKIVVENIADIDKQSQISKLRSELWNFAMNCGWKVSATNIDKYSSVSVPSDSMHGNFLEAINISLNLLDKHFMDRDLMRTGNSIVLISAGTGIFKVRPRLALITKQRMLDNAFGIDFVSLSRPPIHTVPLFVVEGRKFNAKNFYEVPHWMKVSYIDCSADYER